MPAYGIRSGQRTCHNDHFPTEAERERAFAARQAQVEQSFSQGGRYEVLTINENRTQVVNVKKNGQPGKLRFTIDRYTLDRPVCSFGCCRACDALRAAMPVEEKV